MDLEIVDVGTPGADKFSLKQAAIGLASTYVYHRSGVYPTPLPIGLGLKAVGVIGSMGAQNQG